MAYISTDQIMSAFLESCAPNAKDGSSRKMARRLLQIARDEDLKVWARAEERVTKVERELDAFEEDAPDREDVADPKHLFTDDAA